MSPELIGHHRTVGSGSRPGRKPALMYVAEYISALGRRDYRHEVCTMLPHPQRLPQLQGRPVAWHMPSLPVHGTCLLRACGALEVTLDDLEAEKILKELVAELVRRGPSPQVFTSDGESASGWVIGDRRILEDEFVHVGNYKVYREVGQLAILPNATYFEFGTWSENISGRKSSGEFAYFKPRGGSLRPGYNYSSQADDPTTHIRLTLEELALRVRGLLPAG